MQERVENLGSENCRKVIRKECISLSESFRQLRRVSVAVYQSSAGSGNEKMRRVTGGIVYSTWHMPISSLSTIKIPLVLLRRRVRPPVEVGD